MRLKMSLKTKFLIYLGSLLLITVSGVTTFVLYLEKEELYQEKISKATSLLNIMFEMNKESLVLADMVTLSSSVSRVTNSELEVVYALIRKFEGGESFSSNLNDEKKEQEVLEKIHFLSAATETIRQDLILWQEKNNIINLSKSLVINDQLQGEFHIGISEKSIYEAIEVAGEKVIYVGLIALSITLIISLIIVSIAVKPIELLATFANSLEAGNFGETIPITSNDEIGVLGRNMNNMSLSILDHERDLLIKNQLEQSLKEGQEIQNSLLPAELPKIEGFEIGAFSKAAKKISGDFYYFIDLGNGKYGIVIADVSGKGVQAGLIMATALSLIRSIAPKHISPAEVLKEVNKHLHEQIGGLKQKRYVTLIYGILSSDEFVLASAGHGGAPPILFDQENLEIIKLKGKILGRYDSELFDSKIQDKAVRIKKGQSVFLYTDGVDEAGNPDNETFEDEGISRFLNQNKELAPQKCLNSLYETVVEFCQGRDQSDDITMIMIKKS